MTGPLAPQQAEPLRDPERELLRHTLATLAYRGAKVLRGAPPEFAAFRLAPATRTPVEILAHMGDLMEWACHMVHGAHVWRPAAPLPWEEEVERFFTAVARLDASLAADTPLGGSVERLFQGPVADALTHVGQLALLRRLAGSPVRGENYARADIAAGNVGPAQPPSRVEFD